MKPTILLIATAENGLTNRVKADQHRLGRNVLTEIVTTGEDISRAINRHRPDITIATYLKTRIPASVARFKIAILHPGPPGDRGAYALDRAILNGDSRGGVTALAPGLTDTDELDAGPIWAYRVIELPHATKSTLYNTVIADAAVEVAREVVEKALDPEFQPIPQELMERPVPGARPHAPMTRAERVIDWSAPTTDLLRIIRASDGAPGALAEIEGQPFRIFDAHLGRRRGVTAALPGQLIGRHHHAVEVATGDSSLFIGHVRDVSGTARTAKGPAATALSRAGVPTARLAHTVPATWGDIRYQRDSTVGTISLDIYSGAMTTDQCQRLAIALRYAARQSTRVIVLRGDSPYFSNGLHLGAVELAADPAREAWMNLTSINLACRALLSITNQLTISALSGSAGAGGVMLALAAHRVMVADRSVLTPSYRRMGLTGSEFHTFVLPKRIGSATARSLLDTPRAVNAAEALEMGLIDEIGPNRDFAHWTHERARHLASSPWWESAVRTENHAFSTALAGRSLDDIERAELSEMYADIFEDRFGFNELRRQFLSVSPAARAGREARTPTSV